jgi:hypothetical protein
LAARQEKESHENDRRRKSGDISSANKPAWERERFRKSENLKEGRGRDFPSPKDLGCGYKVKKKGLV